MARLEEEMYGMSSPVAKPTTPTPASSGSGGGGGSSYSTPVTTTTDPLVTPGEVDHTIDEDEEANIRAKLPALAQYIDHPEIGPLLREAVKKGWPPEQVQAAVENTDWFQTTEASIREYEMRVARDPASLQRDVDLRSYMLDNMARAQGITMSREEIESFATDVIKYGQSEDEILRILADKARAQVNTTGKLTDGLAAIKQQISTMASSYYLKFDDATLNEYATRIFEGTWSKDAAKATFQSQAQQFFPHLKQQLNDGLTVEDYFAPVKARVASILEMSSADIDLRDPKWSGLTQLVDDKGVMRAPTFTEIDQFARNTDEYGYTKEAIDDSYTVASGFLRKMGVMR